MKKLDEWPANRMAHALIEVEGGRWRVELHPTNGQPFLCDSGANISEAMTKATQYLATVWPGMTL